MVSDQINFCFVSLGQVSQFNNWFLQMPPPLRRQTVNVAVSRRHAPPFNSNGGSPSGI